MTSPPGTPVVNFEIPKASDGSPVSVSASSPLFILGGNGCGKSALVHSLYKHVGLNVVYIPGARPSFFDQEGSTLTPAGRTQLAENLKSWDANPENRWRSANGSGRNHKAVHDLIAAETRFKLGAADQITIEGRQSKAVDRLQARTSPLDRVNQLFKQANLPLTLSIENGDLLASRDNQTYPIAKMSDGERTALVLCSEVIAAPKDAVFLIDEPELHLHRSIVVPLLDALIAERRDCAFIISTHELELPARQRTATKLLVRKCRWKGQEVAGWDFDLLPPDAEIPEDLLLDVLGSRAKLLFVEGDTTSLDQPLYALLFSAVSVRAKATCGEVMRAVIGLRATKQSHRVEAFALVDGDGVAEPKRLEWAAEGIFALPVHNVESLYYSSEVIAAVAVVQGQNLNKPADELQKAAIEEALGAVPDGQISHLTSRLVEQKMRDRVLSDIPKREDIVTSGGSPISISINTDYAAERLNLATLIAGRDLDKITSRYSVRHSKILKGVAKGLRFIDRADYEKAALARISADSTLQAKLKAKFGPLSAVLA